MGDLVGGIQYKMKRGGRSRRACVPDRYSAGPSVESKLVLIGEVEAHGNHAVAADGAVDGAEVGGVVGAAARDSAAGGAGARANRDVQGNG